MDPKEGTSFSGLKTMHLNDQKAGMQGLDKETINKIIFETSKGTPYFAFQEKRQLSIDSKVNELQLEMKQISDAQRKESLAKMDSLCRSLEKERDLTHSIVHIDMDAFYAAVEIHDNPDLKDKPMAVGSSSMLSTSNYHARKYGVRAAMPGFIARKLCPDLVIVPCHFDRYREVSNIIRNIVEDYDPHYSAASLDEVYLDLTEYIKIKHRKHLHEEFCVNNDSSDLFMDENSSNEDCKDEYSNCMGCVDAICSEARDKMAYSIVEEIREKIFKATELTASAGIAPNTMLAKVCSDQNKPNGQYQIISTVEAVKSFISTLPVKKVSGIGPVQGQILNAIGIYTCADMWAQRDLVCNLFSPNSVEFYMRVAEGIGSTTIRSDYERKSIGNERTFKEISKPEELHKKCEELCLNLVEDLKSHNLVGKVVVLKIKTTNFKTHTRNHSLSFYSANPEIICKAVKKLLDVEISAAAPQPLKLRLMGVRMCNLIPEDSISSSEKQQITLKDFLQSKVVPVCSSTKSPSKFKEAFTCPICLEAFETSFNNFNDHVNTCINKQNFNDQTERNEETNLRKNQTSNNESCNDTSLSSRIDFENIEYFCPVCVLSQGVSNLIELNEHIDNCLNKKEIKKILADDNQMSAKRKFRNLQKDCLKASKIPRKEKRIDEYFT